MMSAFPLGRMLVRRSGYGAMQLAGPFAFGQPPDRPSAIGVLRTAVTAGVDHAAVNLRLRGDGRVDARLDDQLAAMVAARDDGLIAGIGLSNVSLEQLQHAVAGEALGELDGVGGLLGGWVGSAG